MENKKHAYGCDHDRLNNLVVPCEKGSFTNTTMKKDFFPTNCADCKWNFLEIRAEITHVKPIRCCKNAHNHRDHKCVWALCAPCYNTKEAEKAEKEGPEAANAKRPAIWLQVRKGSPMETLAAAKVLPVFCLLLVNALALGGVDL
jgi:hypothetical protein